MSNGKKRRGQPALGNRKHDTPAEPPPEERPSIGIGGANEKCEAEKKTQETGQKDRPMQQVHSYIWNKFFEGRSAAWTAAFTAVLAIVTVQLYRVGRIANETSMLSQRSFVSMRSIALNGRVAEPNGRIGWIRMVATWENSGTTPASKCTGRINFAAMGNELQAGYNFPDTSDTPTVPFVIGPKITLNMGSLQIPVHEFEETRTGHHLYIYGWITYDDVFTKERHLTDFCQEVTNVRASHGTDLTDPSTADVLAESISCREHNCYDHDCPDYKQRTQPQPR